MNLSTLLRRTARSAPEALACPQVSWTYAELDRRVDAMAAALGIEVGERVVAACDNGPGYLALHFAVARAGGVLAPANPRSTDHEWEVLIERAEPRRVVLGEGVASAAFDPDSVLALTNLVEASGDGTPSDAPVAPETPAQLYFTSGTTGRPKGVILTHGNVTAHAIAAIAELGLGAQSVWGHFAPMFHLADGWATWAITAVGGQHVFRERFDAEATWELMRSERVTHTNLVPTMLQRMLAVVPEPRPELALEMLLSGGAPIAPSVVRQLREAFGCSYMQTYGMTETAPYLTQTGREALARAKTLEEELQIAARTGRPFLGVSLRVVDGQGREVPHDDESVGEIQVKGPSVTPGYWNDRDATAQAFTDDGYLHTGDLATVDAFGSVRIVDRSKDVILSGGETIYSTEVEHRLLEHPAILQAAVFATPDPDLGERVTAAIVLGKDQSPSDDELYAFCRDHLQGPKCPRHFHRLDDLPRTPSGKVSKRLLRGRVDD